MIKLLETLKAIGEYWKSLLVISSIVTTIITITLKINNRVETDNDKVLEAVQEVDKKIDDLSQRNTDEFGKIRIELTGMNGQMKHQSYNDSITRILIVRHMRETLKELDFYRFMEKNNIELINEKKNFSSFLIP